MGLVFTDSFDYNVNTASPNNYINAKHQRFVAGRGLVGGGNFFGGSGISSGIGRHDKGLQFLASGTSGSSMTTVIDPGLGDPTIIVGYAFKMNSFIGSFVQTLLSVGEVDSIYNLVHVSLTFVGSTVTVAHGSGSPVYGTFAYAGSGWIFMEFKIFVHSTLGYITCRQDGMTVFNVTNQNTRNGGNGKINMVGIGANGNNSNIVNWYIDDYYICTGAGSYNNDFLGDVTIRSLVPTSDVGPNVWTPTPSGAHYATVDDDNTDISTWNTDYLTGTNDNDTEMFGVEDITDTLPSTVAGVMLHCYGEKMDTGTRSLAGVITVGGTTAQSSDYPMRAAAETGAPNFTRHVFDRQPDGSAWSIAAVNAMQAGFKVRP
jgi:hypothetical protein